MRTLSIIKPVVHCMLLCFLMKDARVVIEQTRCFSIVFCAANLIFTLE